MPDKLTWSSQVPLLIEYSIVMNVLITILLGGIGLGAFLVLLFGWSEIYTILQMVTLGTGAIIVISFLILGVSMMNEVKLTFILSENSIQTVLEEETWLTRVFYIFDLLSKPLMVGTSSFSLSQKQTSLVWGDIQKAVIDERKKVVSLSSEKRLLVRLYCNPNVYTEAVGYIERMLPHLEPKYIAPAY
jgi:hypothetical protein